MQAPPLEIQSSLLNMYNVARLSEQSQSALRQQLADEMAARRSGGQSVECVLGLRHLVARR
jgi:hypothetical protein